MKKTIITTVVVGAFAGHSSIYADQSIELSRLIEFEAASSQGKSDVVLATAEVGMSALINDEVKGELTFLYEDERVDVDTAVIHIEKTGSDMFYTLGQMYVPFGRFESNMVSDPFTLTLAETRENTIQLGYHTGSFTTSLYVFNGTNKENLGEANKVDNFGFQLAYEKLDYSFGLSYLNDIGDSDGLQDTINATLGSNDTREHVAGVAMNVGFALNDVNVLAEYVTATDAFEAGELDVVAVKPSAGHFEMAYAFGLDGYSSTFALAYEVSDEARTLDIAKSREMAVLSVNLLKQGTIAFEYVNEGAYDGSDNRVITAQYALEF